MVPVPATSQHGVSMQSATGATWAKGMCYAGFSRISPTLEATLAVSPFFVKSAGGITVSSHLMSLMSQGPFHCAVVESGVVLMFSFITSSSDVDSTSAPNCRKPRVAALSLTSQSPLLCLLNEDNKHSPAIRALQELPPIWGLLRG